MVRAPRVVLTLLTLAAFANAVPNGFVWIDHWQVEQGGLIAHSWLELWDSWHRPLGSMPGWEGAAPYARPLVIAALSLVGFVAGTTAPAYHALLVLLHLGNVLLTYEVLCSLQIQAPVPWLTSAVFAVHPLQTAAVSWISGIADPLFTFFALLAFRLHWAAAERWRHGITAAALVSFALALAAKETAAVLPLLMTAAYFLLPRSRSTALGRRTPVGGGRSGGFPLSFFGLLAIAIVYRVGVLEGSALGLRTDVIPLSLRVATVPRLLLDYVTLPLRLWSLTVCDDFALSSHWDVWTSAAIVAVLGLLIAVVRYRRAHPQIVFAALWFLLGLAPVLQLTPILHYRADRFFYFPFIGWALAGAMLVKQAAIPLAERLGVTRRVLTASAALMLGALAILTVQRNRLFADDRTLFEATLKTSPHCREAHAALGDAYLRAGREDDAVTQYELALASAADRASYFVAVKVLINLGMAELRQSHYGAALGAFERAHELQPGLLHPLFGLGAANLGLQRPAEALPFLEQAYAQDANDPDIVFSLGRSYDVLGRSNDAQRLYRRYLEIAPHGQARGIADDRLQRLAHRRAPEAPD